MGTWELRKSCIDCIGCTRHPEREEEGGEEGALTAAASGLLGSSNEKPARTLRRAPAPAGSDCSLCSVIISSIFCDGRAGGEQEREKGKAATLTATSPHPWAAKAGAPLLVLPILHPQAGSWGWLTLTTDSGPTPNPIDMLKGSCQWI